MKSAFFKSLLATAVTAGAGVYNYNSNGADWGTAVADSELCDTGKEQSPIDLVRSSTEGDKNMMIEGFGYQNYPGGKLTLSKLSSTL